MKFPLSGALSRRVSLAIQWRVDVALDPIMRRVDDLERRIVRLEELDPARAAWLEKVDQDNQRIGPQVAGLEVRMADLKERVASASSASVDELDTATQREEIARARVRLAAVSQFEERLRRLESASTASSGEAH